MKQIVQSARSGKLEVKDVPAPRAGANEILVETRASLISAGTDRMTVDFAKKSLAGKAKARPDLVKKVIAKAKTDGIEATMHAVLNRLDEPLPLGYSAAGTVIEVGRGLEGAYKVGDRVALAGAGIANHAEINAVPRNLAARIPDDVSDEHASFGTLGAIALHAVRNLDAKMGEVVAVIGAGLVGQLAAQFLRISGVRVVVLDYDNARLDLARQLGAELAVNPKDGALAEQITTLTNGIGCDAILLAAATDSNEPFETAAEIARDRARVCMVGFSGTTFPYAAFMKKELSLVVSRSYGPGRYDEDFEGRDVKYPEGFVRWTETENLAEALRLMSPSLSNRLDVGALISHRFPITDAEAAYELVTVGTEAQLGVILTYLTDQSSASSSKIEVLPSAAKPGDCVLGLIGAGNFARAMLLPALKKLPDVELHTVVSKRGASAEHSQQKFGFREATTDENAIINNPEINAVVIATRHDSHAELTAAALKAGKSVYVEKPLGLTHAEIATVADARVRAAGFFQIGFNRRFAPLAGKAQSQIAGIGGTKFVLLRVNAGAVPADSWIHAPTEGGGRIIGEVCHFVDLARYFVGASITSVQADSATSSETVCDDVTATLRFADGSLATIAYTALGDDSYPKERFEIYAGGSVIALDNFRKLSVNAGGSENTTSARGQDKGHNGSLAAFVKAVTAGGPAPIDENELFETSRATLAILDSLQQGTRIDL